jgi:hypothetical protein
MKRPISYSLYSEATAGKVATTLAELSLADLRTLLPGMITTGGDGLKLLRAEVARRGEPGQVFPPACPSCLQRPEQCVCPTSSLAAA